MYRSCLKRVLDILLSGCALLALWPVLAVVAVLVRCKLGSPVIFCQERPGKDERIFKLYKFRTMTDARDEGGNLLPDDVRLTKFGRLLRSASLDELPELWNILRGDMSLVGPRPLLVRYLPRYSREQRFAYDVAYVENITFWGDVKILLETVKKVVMRAGIRSETAVTMEEFMGAPEEVTHE